MLITLTETDYIDLKNMVEQTLDNIECMGFFDESISNLEQMKEILERVSYGNRN